MAESRTNRFSPPTTEQVARLLEEYPPRPPSRLIAWSPILLMVVIAVTMLTGLAMLGWLMALGGIAALGWRVKYIRHLEAQIARTDELAMLRWWPTALRSSWKLVPKVAAMPTMHGRVVAMLAHSLDQVKAYDAAIEVYDFLIGHLPADHPVAIQLNISRSLAQLHNEQLIDADDALRRLRNLPKVFENTPVSAALRLANLAQQVQTNHLDDALGCASTLVDDLRPLGVTAGFGHALMASTCHQLSQGGDLMLKAEAGVWWSRATLLLPPGALVDRYPQLKQVAESLGSDQSRSVPPQGESI